MSLDCIALSLSLCNKAYQNECVRYLIFSGVCKFNNLLQSFIHNFSSAVFSFKGYTGDRRVASSSLTGSRLSLCCVLEQDTLSAACTVEIQEDLSQPAQHD